jgi:hypothetical protein
LSGTVEAVWCTIDTRLHCASTLCGVEYTLRFTFRRLHVSQTTRASYSGFTKFRRKTSLSICQVRMRLATVLCGLQGCPADFEISTRHQRRACKLQPQTSAKSEFRLSITYPGHVKNLAFFRSWEPGLPGKQRFQISHQDLSS